MRAYLVVLFILSIFLFASAVAFQDDAVESLASEAETSEFASQQSSQAEAVESEVEVEQTTAAAALPTSMCSNVVLSSDADAAYAARNPTKLSSDLLAQGAHLDSSNALTSANGQYQLVMQADGNVAVVKLTAAINMLEVEEEMMAPPQQLKMVSRKEANIRKGPKEAKKISRFGDNKWVKKPKASGPKPYCDIDGAKKKLASIQKKLNKGGMRPMERVRLNKQLTDTSVSLSQMQREFKKSKCIKGKDPKAKKTTSKKAVVGAKPTKKSVNIAALFKFKKSDPVRLSRAALDKMLAENAHEMTNLKESNQKKADSAQSVLEKLQQKYQHQTETVQTKANEKIHDLNSVILAKLNSMQGASEADKAKIMQSITDMQAKVDAAKKKLAAVTQKLSQAQQDQLKAAQLKLKETIASGKKAEMEAKKAQEGKVASSEQQVAAAKRQAEQQERVKSVVTDINAVLGDGADYNDLMAAKQELRRLIASIGNQGATLLSVETEVTCDTDALKKQVADLKSKLKSTSDKKDAQKLKNRIKKLNKKISNNCGAKKNSSKPSSKKAAGKPTTKPVTAVSPMAAKLQTLLDQLDSKISVSKKKLGSGDLQSDFKKKADALVKTQLKMARKQELKNVKAAAAAKQRDLKLQLNEKKEQADVSAANFKAKIKHLKADSKQAVSDEKSVQVHQQAKQVAQMKAAEGRLLKQILDLQDQVASLKLQAEATTNLDAKAKLLIKATTLDLQIAPLQSSLSKLKFENLQKTHDIKKYGKSKVRGVESKFETKIKALSAAAKSDAVKYEKSINKLKKQIVKVKTDAQKKAAAIKAGKGVLVGETCADLKRMNAKRRALKQKLASAMSAQKIVIKSKISKLVKKILKLKTKCNPPKPKTEASSVESKLKTQIHEVKQAIKKVKKSLSQAKIDLGTALASEKSEVSIKIADLKQKLTSNKKQLKSLLAKLKFVQSLKVVQVSVSSVQRKIGKQIKSSQSWLKLKQDELEVAAEDDKEDLKTEIANTKAALAKLVDAQLKWIGVYKTATGTKKALCKNRQLHQLHSNLKQFMTNVNHKSKLFSKLLGAQRAITELHKQCQAKSSVPALKSKVAALKKKLSTASGDDKSKLQAKIAKLEKKIAAKSQSKKSKSTVDVAALQAKAKGKVEQLTKSLKSKQADLEMADGAQKQALTKTVKTLQKQLAKAQTQQKKIDSLAAANDIESILNLKIKSARTALSAATEQKAKWVMSDTSKAASTSLAKLAKKLGAQLTQKKTDMESAVGPEKKLLQAEIASIKQKLADNKRTKKSLATLMQATGAKDAKTLQKKIKLLNKLKKQFPHGPLAKSVKSSLKLAQQQLQAMKSSSPLTAQPTQAPSSTKLIRCISKLNQKLQAKQSALAKADNVQKPVIQKQIDKLQSKLAAKQSTLSALPQPIKTTLIALGQDFNNQQLVAGSQLQLSKSCELQVISPSGKVMWTPKVDTSELSSEPVSLGQCYLVIRDDGDVALYGSISAGSPRSQVWSTSSCADKDF